MSSSFLATKKELALQSVFEGFEAKTPLHFVFFEIRHITLSTDDDGGALAEDDRAVIENARGDFVSAKALFHDAGAIKVEENAFFFRCRSCCVVDYVHALFVRGNAKLSDGANRENFFCLRVFSVFLVVAREENAVSESIRKDENAVSFVDCGDSSLYAFFLALKITDGKFCLFSIDFGAF